MHFDTRYAGRIIRIRNYIHSMSPACQPLRNQPDGQPRLQWQLVLNEVVYAENDAQMLKPVSNRLH